jgi:arylsulfatase A-like enzyme
VESAETGRPNVLLIVLDTVRADHMSCYGYTRNTTPNVDGLAADGRLYTNVLSPSCWTLPSHASMFTGLPNSAHGCNWSHPYLDEDFETLAERLQRQGYQTGGFSSNPVVSVPRGLAQGFERFWVPQESTTRGYTFLQRFRDRFGEKEARPVAPDMHAALGEWFRDDYEPDRPFFVFLNYIEPHAPYSPRSHALEWATPETARRWRSRDQIDLTHRYIFGLDVVSAGEMGELETLYDEEIAFVDRKVGELLDLLRRSGLYDNTCIIVTSDHGEHFGEHHLMGHQFSLYEPLVRVPLIVRHPSTLGPGWDGSLVQTNDVFATVLDIAGVEWRVRAEHDTLSLLADEERSEAYSEHLAPAVWRISRFSDTLPTVDTSRIWRRLRAVQRGNVKMIRSFEGECELYDLAADPLETRDLAAEQADTVLSLEQALAAWTGSFEHYVPKPVTAETLRQLPGDELETMRGLGYIR